MQNLDSTERRYYIKEYKESLSDVKKFLTQYYREEPDDEKLENMHSLLMCWYNFIQDELYNS